MLWNKFTKENDKIIGDAITVSLRNQASLPDGKYTLLDLIIATRKPISDESSNIRNGKATSSLNGSQKFKKN